MGRSIGHKSLLLVLAGIGLASTGCMKSLWNGLADPTQLGHFGTSPVLNEIRTTLTIHDEPPGLPGAEEPRPEDAVARSENYTLVANDMVQVTIYELFGPRIPTVATPRVSDVGEIFILEVGYIDNVIGMTSRQLQDAIVARLAEREILRDPLVEVSVLTQIGRTYTVDGSVAVSAGPSP